SLRREGGHVGLGDRDQQLALPRQPNGHWLRLDFDATVAHPDVERHAGLQAGFASYVLGDHQSSGRINGSFHGMDPTTPMTARPDRQARRRRYSEESARATRRSTSPAPAALGNVQALTAGWAHAQTQH